MTTAPGKERKLNTITKAETRMHDQTTKATTKTTRKLIRSGLWHRVGLAALCLLSKVRADDFLGLMTIGFDDPAGCDTEATTFVYNSDYAPDSVSESFVVGLKSLSTNIVFGEQVSGPTQCLDRLVPVIAEFRDLA